MGNTGSKPDGLVDYLQAYIKGLQENYIHDPKLVLLGVYKLFQDNTYSIGITSKEISFRQSLNQPS